MDWKRLLAYTGSHMDVLAATDFFTAEVWTQGGLVTYYVVITVRPTSCRSAAGRRPVRCIGLFGDFALVSSNRPAEGSGGCFITDVAHALLSRHPLHLLAEFVAEFTHQLY